MELDREQVQSPIPRITDFRDYRLFLKAFHEHKKSLNLGWSFRLFSQRAGIKSPNYLQLVIQGQRNLSDEMAHRTAKAMALGKDERDYFVAMVQLTNCRSQEDELLAQRKLLRSLKKLVTSTVSRAQMQVLQQWYTLAVRELVHFDDFVYSGKWVSEKLKGLMTEEEALVSLQVLVEGGFISQNDQGIWEQVEPVIDTGPEGFDEALILESHKKSLSDFSRLVEKLPKEERELGLLTIGMQSSRIPELKERIREFQDEIIGWLHAEEKPDTIVALGTYLLPLTALKK